MKNRTTLNEKCWVLALGSYTTSDSHQESAKSLFHGPQPRFTSSIWLKYTIITAVSCLVESLTTLLTKILLRSAGLNSSNFLCYGHRKEITGSSWESPVFIKTGCSGFPEKSHLIWARTPYLYLWRAKADKTIFRARGFNFFKFRARGFHSFYFARADASTWQNCFNFVLQRYVLLQLL